MLTLMRSVASLSAAAAWNLSGPGMLAFNGWLRPEAFLAAANGGGLGDKYK